MFTLMPHFIISYKDFQYYICPKYESQNTISKNSVWIDVYPDIGWCKSFYVPIDGTNILWESISSREVVSYFFDDDIRKQISNAFKMKAFW